MNQTDLADLLANFLQVKRYKDYTVNGLQVQGRNTINRIVTAVTASQAAIDKAIAVKAEALIVHHGYFWRGETMQIVGIKRRRLKSLLAHDINLYAYHLPLDQHPQLGNNVLFGQLFSPISIWQSDKEPMIWHANIASISLTELSKKVSQLMHRQANVIEVSAKAEVERIAWCTGAAQDFMSQAAEEGAQVFITGEYAERSFHEAHELGCHFIACGHHASERAGIQALGKWLNNAYNLENIFFDEGNPF